MQINVHNVVGVALLQATLIKYANYYEHVDRRSFLEQHKHFKEFLSVLCLYILYVHLEIYSVFFFSPSGSL